MTTTDIRQTVRYLETLGPTLIAYTAGARKRELIKLWETGEASPSEQEAKRLTTAEAVIRRVADEDGLDVARAWFIGQNTCVPNSDEYVSPAEAIRDDYFDQVERSADGFINDEWLD